MNLKKGDIINITMKDGNKIKRFWIAKVTSEAIVVKGYSKRWLKSNDRQILFDDIASIEKNQFSDASSMDKIMGKVFVLALVLALSS